MTSHEDQTSHREFEVKEKQKYLKTLMLNVQVLEKSGEQDLINFYFENVEEVNEAVEGARQVGEDIQEEERKMKEEPSRSEAKFTSELVRFYEQIANLVFERKAHLLRKLEKLKAKDSRRISQQKIQLFGQNSKERKGRNRSDPNNTSNLKEYDTQSENYYIQINDHEHIQNPATQGQLTLHSKNEDRNGGYSVKYRGPRNQHIENQGFATASCRPRNVNHMMSEFDKESAMRFRGQEIISNMGKHLYQKSLSPPQMGRYQEQMNGKSIPEFETEESMMIARESALRNRRLKIRIRKNQNNDRILAKGRGHSRSIKSDMFVRDNMEGHQQMFQRKQNFKESPPLGNHLSEVWKPQNDSQRMGMHNGEFGNRPRHRRCQTDLEGVIIPQIRGNETLTRQKVPGSESQLGPSQVIREDFAHSNNPYLNKDNQLKLNIIESDGRFLNKNHNKIISGLNSMTSINPVNSYGGKDTNQPMSPPRSPRKLNEARFHRKKKLQKGNAVQNFEFPNHPKNNKVFKKNKGNRVVSEQHAPWKTSRFAEVPREDKGVGPVRKQGSFEELKLERIDIRREEKGVKTERIQRRGNRSKPKVKKAKKKVKKRNLSNKSWSFVIYLPY